MRAARALALDTVTAEVVGAFDAAGIRSIVLKGPSIARWLYPAGGRTYRDSDVLVAPTDFSRAAVVLEDLGFVDFMDAWRSAERPLRETERAYVRSADAGGWGVVDLHRSLPGLSAHADVLWEAFDARTESMRVGGGQVRVLGMTALALHIVLHAVQHRHGHHTSDDLRRLLEALPSERWIDVAELAAVVGASEGLALGLRQATRGVAIAEALELGVPAVDRSTWGPFYAPRGLGTLAKLGAQPTWLGRAAHVRSALVPSRAKLRYMSVLPADRRGALARAYMAWWWGLARALPEAVRYSVGRRRSSAGRRYSSTKP